MRHDPDRLCVDYLDRCEVGGDSEGGIVCLRGPCPLLLCCRLEREP